MFINEGSSFSLLKQKNCEIVLNKFLVDCFKVLMIVPTDRLGIFSDFPFSVLFSVTFLLRKGCHFFNGDPIRTVFWISPVVGLRLQYPFCNSGNRFRCVSWVTFVLLMLYITPSRAADCDSCIFSILPDKT